MPGYVYNGLYQIDGIRFNANICKESLIKTRDELVLDPSDVIVSDYPKSGTTWVGQVLHAIDVGVEAALARTDNLSDTYMPFIDFFPGDSSKPPYYEQIVARPPPRRIKTHLYVDYFKRLLENEATSPKVITIYRNPKDTLVSYFFMHKVFSDDYDKVPWDEYFDMFKEKTLLWGDIFDYHLGWWKYRHHPKVLHLHYEDLHTDAAATIRRMAQFVGRPVTDDDVQKIIELSSFDKMKARGLHSYLHDAYIYSEKNSPFFRKGVKGDWRNYFSQEQSDYVDEVVKTRCEPVGLTYTY